MTKLKSILMPFYLSLLIPFSSFNAAHNREKFLCIFFTTMARNQSHPNYAWHFMNRWGVNSQILVTSWTSATISALMFAIKIYHPLCHSSLLSLSMTLKSVLSFVLFFVCAVHKATDDGVRRKFIHALRVTMLSTTNAGGGGEENATIYWYNLLRKSIRIIVW